VRVDSGVFGGWTVPPHYDSLLAKVIVHAPTREQALIRMQRALNEYIISGIRTNIDLHKQLLALPEVMEGRMTTRTVENFMAARANAN
jgi:acetyl-CoA carboxylase, biotin carboxylase subunit